jgi:site-specific DNA-methyltransferase (adenine-specific)
MVRRIHFSSATQHWATPGELYADLDREFRFDFDPCPLGERSGGLIAEAWRGRRVFCNPPYGPVIRMFLQLAIEAEVAVYLLPARTDTRWFHEIVLSGAREVRFLKGRLKFGGAIKDAPFPSMIVVFSNSAHEQP